MHDNGFSAEVVPDDGQAQSAALALQRLGFRVLHIGSTISIEGPEGLWRSVFEESFVKRQNSLSAKGSKGGDEHYQDLVIDRTELPAELEKYVSQVVLVEPPDFF